MIVVAEEPTPEQLFAPPRIWLVLFTLALIAASVGASELSGHGCLFGT